MRNAVKKFDITNVVSHIERYIKKFTHDCHCGLSPSAILRINCDTKQSHNGR